MEAPLKGDKTTYSYNANGNPASTVEPRGDVTGANPADALARRPPQDEGRLLEMQSQTPRT